MAWLLALSVGLNLVLGGALWSEMRAVDRWRDLAVRACKEEVYAKCALYDVRRGGGVV